MSEINESTVNTGEPIVKTGSTADAISFDQLEAITDSKGKPHQDEVPKARSAIQKKDENGDDIEKKAKKQDKELDDDEPPKVDKTKVKDGEEDPDAPKIKTLKMKNGDEDLEVPSGAKIKVKVAGKEEDVDLQTLVNEYSGKTNWGRKFQELDTERKTFQAERQDLQSGIDELFDLAVTKNQPMDAVQMLSEMLGGDGIKTVTDLRERMFKEFEEYSKLTPEQNSPKLEKKRHSSKPRSHVETQPKRRSLSRRHSQSGLKT